MKSYILVTEYLVFEGRHRQLNMCHLFYNKCIECVKVMLLYQLFNYVNHIKMR